MRHAFFKNFCGPRNSGRTKTQWRGRIRTGDPVASDLRRTLAPGYLSSLIADNAPIIQRVLSLVYLHNTAFVAVTVTAIVVTSPRDHIVEDSEKRYANQKLVSAFAYYIGTR